jgi:predicted secreted Zn-dependent protease
LRVWIVLDRFGYVMQVFRHEETATQYAHRHGFTLEPWLVSLEQPEVSWSPS